MKKLLSILCVSIIALTAASCKKETVVQGGNTNSTVYYHVKPTDWALTNDGKFYSYTRDIPELDNTYSEKGAVLVYLAEGGGEDWEFVPEVFNNTAFSFTHRTGSVTIYSQNANGSAPVRPSVEYDIKVVMIDSNVL